AAGGHEAPGRARRGRPHRAHQGRPHRHGAPVPRSHAGSAGLAAPLRALLEPQPRPPGRLRGKPRNRPKEPQAMTSLTLLRRINAQPATVFEALTTPEGISHWWGPDDGPVLLAETDVRVGGPFRVRFLLLAEPGVRVGGRCRVRCRMRDGSEHESSGEYLRVEPPRRLEMSWRWADDTAGPDSRVVGALRAIDSGTELTFTHDGLRDEATARSHESGWGGALDKLVRHYAA